MGYGGFHPKTMVPSHNWKKKLLPDINLCKNLKAIFWGEAIGNFSSVNNGMVEGSREVEKIKTRTMIIHGVEDATIPISHAEQMAK
jgi:pimeloyl-ACP methyl ester carboxylesterase